MRVPHDVGIRKLINVKLWIVHHLESVILHNILLLDGFRGFLLDGLGYFLSSALPIIYHL